jgi:hypothetical protein
MGFQPLVVDFLAAVAIRALELTGLDDRGTEIIRRSRRFGLDGKSVLMLPTAVGEDHCNPCSILRRLRVRCGPSFLTAKP